MSNDSSNYPVPRKRASGFQRASVSNALQFAFDDSQLNFAEFTERNEKAIRVTYLDELIPLVADLSLGPELPPISDKGYLTAVSQRFQQPIMPDQIDKIHQPQPALVERPAQKSFLSSLLAPADTADSPDLYSVLGEVSKDGHWVCPASAQVLVICGEADINLVDAQVTSMHTTIRIMSIMGEVTIVVPEEFRVINNVSSFMGSAKLSDSRHTISMSSLDDNSPTLTITGTALLSEVKIKRVKPKRR